MTLCLNTGGGIIHIPDGVLYGEWHSSGTYVNEFPDIKLNPSFSSKVMFDKRATFLVFKPYWLVIEGELEITFPFSLTFKDGKLIKIDGETELVPYFPINIEEYDKIDKETKDKFFDFQNQGEFAIPVSLKIKETFRCDGCADIIVTFSDESVRNFHISEHKYVNYGFYEQNGSLVSDPIRYLIVKLWEGSFNK